MSPSIALYDGLFVRALGSLTAWRDSEEIHLRGWQTRAALAVLLVSHERVVSTDEMIEHIWEGHPSKSSEHGLHVVMSRLRTALESRDQIQSSSRRLLSQPPGYRLVLPLGEFDVAIVENLLRKGRRSMAVGDFSPAERFFVAAENLWKGEPYAEFAYAEFAQAEIRRLGELRLGSLEDRADVQLELGRHHELVPELESLVVQHPTRERFLCQLMKALCRSDRPADAVAVFKEVRDRMTSEYGMAPGIAAASLFDRIQESGAIAG